MKYVKLFIVGLLLGVFCGSFAGCASTRYPLGEPAGHPSIYDAWDWLKYDVAGAERE